MRPVRKYIEKGEWDRARTNINYCTRNLRLKTNMKMFSEIMDDPLEVSPESLTSSRLSSRCWKKLTGQTRIYRALRLWLNWKTCSPKWTLQFIHRSSFQATKASARNRKSIKSRCVSSSFYVPEIPPRPGHSP